MTSDGGAQRILIVAGCATAARQMASYFADHNLSVGTASQQQIMASRLPVRTHLLSAPSLVILDLRPALPGGLDLVREIRARSAVPLIVIAGRQGEAMEHAAEACVASLELGADHYLTEPLALRELLARARAVLRRQAGRKAGICDRRRDGVPDDGGGYYFGDWQLHRRSRRVSDPAGNRVALTKSEYALLLAFLGAPGRPLTREHLMRSTRIHENVADRSVDVQVLRLRRKLEGDPAAPPAIRTEHGIGYSFAWPVVEVGQASTMLDERSPPAA
ncbi:MAG: response regulator transcription factor [Dongiaceae bacterium]